MLNIQESNFALISGRAGQVVGGDEWNLSFITDKISDVNLFYRGGAVLFPLYVLRNGTETMFLKEIKMKSMRLKLIMGKKEMNFTKKKISQKIFVIT